MFKAERNIGSRSEIGLSCDIESLQVLSIALGVRHFVSHCLVCGHCSSPLQPDSSNFSFEEKTFRMKSGARCESIRSSPKSCGSITSSHCTSLSLNKSLPICRLLSVLQCSQHMHKLSGAKNVSQQTFPIKNLGQYLFNATFATASWPHPCAALLLSSRWVESSAPA